MKKTKKALAVVLGTLLVACMSLFVLAACGPKEPKALDSIEITTQPTKTTYVEGEKFDPAGMVVTAKFNDESTEAVTDYTLNPSATTELTPANDKVTVSYKYEDVTKKADVAITVKAWDADIPEDNGTLADHVFEAEAAEYTGISSNNGSNFGHACMGKSYFFDASLSGGICVRNVSPKSGDAETENNALTFKFTSDKSVKVKMELSVASRYDNKAWVALAFNQMYTTVVNGRTISGDVEVPAATEAEKIQNNNYACMKTIEIPVTLQEGENTIVFKALAKSCNLDYINIKTSANLTGWTNHYWGDANTTVEISKAPTLKATGKIKFLCSGETAVADHFAEFTLPALTDDFYTDNGDGSYSFTVMGKTFKIVAEEEKPAKYVATIENDFTSTNSKSLKFVSSSVGTYTNASANDEEFHNGLGSFDSVEKYVSYVFNLEADGTVDFVWYVAGSLYDDTIKSNKGIEDLGKHLQVTIDGELVSVDGLALPAGTGNASVWWNMFNIVIKNVSLKAGEHTFKAEVIEKGGLNVAHMTVYSSAEIKMPVIDKTELTGNKLQYNPMDVASWYKFGTNGNNKDGTYTDEQLKVNGALTFTSENTARMDLFKIDAMTAADKATWVNISDKTDNLKAAGKAFYGYEYTYDFALSATGNFSLILFGTAKLPATFNGTENRGLYLFFTDGLITVKQSGAGKDAVQATAQYTGAITDITSLTIAVTRLNDNNILIKISVNGQKVNFKGVPTVAKLTADGNYIDTVVTATSGYGQRFGVVPEKDKTVSISSIKVSKSDKAIGGIPEAQSYSYTSVGLEEKEGKVYYVISGKGNFDLTAFKFAFDLQKNDNIDKAGWGNINFADEKIKVEFGENNTFKVYIDVTDLEANGQTLTPHGGFVNKLDVKAGGNGTKLVASNGKTYEIVVSGATWNCSSLKVSTTAPAQA